MSEIVASGQDGETETQQALLRHTIDLNTEMIAQADRLISESRTPRLRQDLEERSPDRPGGPRIKLS